MAGAKAAVMKAVADAETAATDCCAGQEFQEFYDALPANCEDDLKGIVTDVKAAVQDFEKKTIGGITDGVK